jgi:hypothetical protein
MRAERLEVRTAENLATSNTTMLAAVGQRRDRRLASNEENRQPPVRQCSLPVCANDTTGRWVRATYGVSSL